MPVFLLRRTVSRQVWYGGCCALLFFHRRAWRPRIICACVYLFVFWAGAVHKVQYHYLLLNTWYLIFDVHMIGFRIDSALQPEILRMMFASLCSPCLPYPLFVLVSVFLFALPRRLVRCGREVLNPHENLCRRRASDCGGTSHRARSRCCRWSGEISKHERPPSITRS